MSTPNPLLSAADAAAVAAAAETLQGVLNDIVTNRKALADQITAQTAQIAAGQAQLTKFDTLIATLQVALADEQSIGNVVVQQGANAVSPTPAASSAPAPAAAAPAKTAA